MSNSPRRNVDWIGASPTPTKGPPKEGILLPAGHDVPAGDLPDQIEMLARWMDAAFEIPGIKLRFGLDAIIGLIPGLGDTITSVVSLYILSTASRYGVPKVTMLRMAANIALDYVFGSIPLLGDVFDVYWKANLKNATLLKKYAAAAPVDRRRHVWGDRLFVGALMIVLVCLAIGSVMAAFAILRWLFGLLQG